MLIQEVQQAGNIKEDFSRGGDCLLLSDLMSRVEGHICVLA